MAVLLCAKLNWKPWNGHTLYVLRFILVLVLRCTWKHCHLFLYQYLVQDTKCFQPVAEGGQKRVWIKCVLRAAKWGKWGDSGKEGVVIVHSLCLISSQQISKVLSFTFYCFCCLLSLHFFPQQFSKEIRYFLLYWGYIFLL